METLKKESRGRFCVWLEKNEVGWLYIVTASYLPNSYIIITYIQTIYGRKICKLYSAVHFEQVTQILLVNFFSNFSFVWCFKYLVIYQIYNLWQAVSDMAGKQQNFNKYKHKNAEKLFFCLALFFWQLLFFFSTLSVQVSCR